MALDATPGGANSNSYVTQADATEYLTEERLYVDEWTAATDADKDKALIWATAILDQSFNWNGAPRNREIQALRWPRIGVWTSDNEYIDQDTIPKAVEDATAELALHLLREAADPTQESDLLGLGFSQARVGPISVTIDSSQDVAEMIPDQIRTMLADYGRIRAIASKGTRTVKLRRV